MQSSSVIAPSPSFTVHSSNDLADIAARVVEEFHHQNDHDFDDIYNFNQGTDEFNANNEQVDAKTPAQNVKDDDSDEDEFEFAILHTDTDSSLVSADKMFSGGQMLPRYPLFDQSLLLDNIDSGFSKVVDGPEETDPKSSPVVRLPLKKLFMEERDLASCSSSEADDLDGVPPDTYCVWKPNTESPERCKKSNSTGNTSKRWKFRDLIRRSNSDGRFTVVKEKPFVLLTPSIATNNTEKANKFERTAKVAAAGEFPPSNKATKGDSRHRSYLPYRQDLVGVLANVNGLNRNLKHGS